MASNGEPTQHNLVQYTGTTFEGEVSLIDSATRDPVNLSGASGTIVVTDKDGATAMSTEVVVTDADGGTFAWEVAASVTAEVTPSRYSYLVQIDWPDGTKKIVLTGTLDVRRGVTA